jgi:hypothetical protein
MGNPYSSQSISGYNASPPTDDGAETSANTVKWATHKTKLGDPIKTLAEAINTELTSAFGLLFGQTIVSKSSAYTIAASDRGSVVSVTGTTTITLLAAATAGDGFPLLIVNTGSAVVTVDGNSSETINGSTSLVLWPDDYLLLTCDGSSWAAAGRFAEAGSFTPTYAAGFSADPTGDFEYVKRGNDVWVTTPGTSGTSNSASLTISNWPDAIRPAANRLVLCAGMEDNGADVFGQVVVPAAGNAIFYPENINSLWTASGAKGWGNNAGVAPNFSYPLRTA